MNHGRRLHYLSTLQPPNPPGGVPDADLLARWVTQRDQVAFELLVRRHSPLVLGTCRRLLCDPNDVDDVFQAVFLVLARKAGSVARGEVLAAWLHRVACRAALRVRADRAKRMTHSEPGVIDHLPAPAQADPAWAELLRALDEEVARLPARHRVVFVLCCLEGKTGEEAGRVLGCPPGTVSSRLTRARERLRARLTRRGFAPVALGLVALTGDARAVIVPNTLIESVTRTAPVFSARWSPGGPPFRPAAIAEGVIRAMFVNKIKLVSALLLVGLLAAGAVLAGAAPGNDGNPNRDPEPPQPAPKGGAGVKGPPDATRPAAVPVVRLVEPQPGGLDRVAIQRCVTEAGRQSHLFPTVAGALKRVDADIGDRVKAGQLLAEIDAPTLALDERMAAVGVEQARGLLKEAEARVATAKVETEAAKGLVKVREAEATVAKANVDLRQKQLDRLKELSKKGLVGEDSLVESESQLHAAEGQAAAAAASVESAKADVAVRASKTEQAVAGLTTAKANVEAAMVGLERARLAVAQTRIAAPFDGIVAARGYQPGDVVRPGERGDAPLFTVMRADFLRLVVWVPERDATRFEPGLAAEVTIDAFPDVKLVGRVARVGFAIEPQQGAVRAEIDLPNPKGNIRPGMTGTVSVKLGKGPADALRVPAGSVVTIAAVEEPAGKPTTAVYVYKDGKARLTRVGVSYTDGREAEVVSGLTADDRVVTDPKDLAPKTEVPVEIEKPAPPK